MKFFLRKQGKPTGKSFDESPCRGAKEHTIFFKDKNGLPTLETYWYVDYNNVEDLVDLSKELNCKVTIDGASTYNGSYVATLSKTRNK